MQILIKYHTDLPPIEQIPGGDWLDLRAAETVDMQKGEYRPISLGVSMKLPKGYEAHVAPRSSTFKKWGILMVNSVGVVDESYCGEEDIWYFVALATRDTHIEKGDRICQFRIVQKMPAVELIPVFHMMDESRGGIGSTGTK